MKYDQDAILTRSSHRLSVTMISEMLDSVLTTTTRPTVPDSCSALPQNLIANTVIKIRPCHSKGFDSRSPVGFGHYLLHICYLSVLLFGLFYIPRIDRLPLYPPPRSAPPYMSQSPLRIHTPAVAT
ncbi:hypothetical protein GALMADRAFT_219091 [Galerina marginata CBS 339.88]|uniref:Uncharacterized protein n=1 Tax=Galerina marginata (strain CBS 339.88) TaxID=685588 RepID=A0A067TSC6_GALM3|nr:hypothetical protein GALMADRAFT_219091 [Galerina marginata CBS 339.88]